MYEWLTDALQGPSTVVTANRRLARVLREEFAQQQRRAGKVAWQSPAVHSWQSWLEILFRNASDQASLPVRINQQQCQLLWERCLGKELNGRKTALAGLVRLSRDTWQRLADWRVTIGDVARAAQNHDQRLFAVAAGRYLGVLEREHWVDDAGLGSLADDLIRNGRTPIEGLVTFAGFDRERPVVKSIRASLASHGCDVQLAPVPNSAESVDLQIFDTVDAELRAAAAWAREMLQENPGHSIAIIAADLQQNALRKTHLIREGLVPGWQYAPPAVARSVNVSYGRTLTEFPAVSVALLLLNWLVRDLTALEIGQLLRTPLIGKAGTGGRSRLELRLRQLPDRGWSPAMLSAALRSREDSPDASDWLGLVASITKLRRELRKSASPAEWAVYIDATLDACKWPGEGVLSSFDFQLVNRWRDLLNDLARLDLVSPSMDLEDAIRRLELMASESVFQPESEDNAVQLIGPLEASGAEFDAIWISGLSANNWPPPGNPSPLVSRGLQQKAGMPDAEPSDTVAYAEKLLLRLSGAAPTVICSYALTEDDAQQSPSTLLTLIGAHEQAAQRDPGWHATALSGTECTVVVDDAVPGIGPNENVAGGAGTIQRQLSDPISAFTVGRLGVRNLQMQAVGLPAQLRGNIIHDALYRLYGDTPTRDEIASWPDDELKARLERAIESTFSRHERHADEVLVELFKLERIRIAGLLRRFVKLDCARQEFDIVHVEHDIAFSLADVRMQLRVDRIDRFADRTLAILDYKTGATKRFLRGDGYPREIQLVAYACALEGSISAMALANIDTREVNFDGTGQSFDGDEYDGDGWRDSLAEWERDVEIACAELSRGDVRINGVQAIEDARSHNLLSRYTELRRHD